MDFTNFFRNLMELIETVAMLGGLVYITRALRLRDDRKAAKPFNIFNSKAGDGSFVSAYKVSELF